MHCPFELVVESKYAGPRRKSPFSKRTEMFEVSESKDCVFLKMLEIAGQEGVVSETQYCSHSCQVPF